MRLALALCCCLALAACGSDPAADKNVPGPAADFSFNTIHAPLTSNAAEENATLPLDVPATEPVAVIPEAFHGEWDTDAAACKRSGSETRLVVAGGTMRFHESVALVRKVEVVSEETLDVTAEYRGEGQVWQNERRLTLGKGGKALTVAGEGSTLVRRRCDEA